MARSGFGVEKDQNRMLREMDDNDDPTRDSKEPTKRSERKRQREKQRRFDLSNAFDELAAFITQIEPDSDLNEADARKKRKKVGDGEDVGGITRLDIIGRALKLMKRLHRENEERKRIIESMRQSGGSMAPNDNVFVMVPTLAPVEEGSHPVARASYSYGPPPSGYYQQGPPLSHHGPPDYSVSMPHGRQPHHYSSGPSQQWYGGHAHQYPPGVHQHHMQRGPPSRSPGQPPHQDPHLEDRRGI